jgi:hypothetical protein
LVTKLAKRDHKDIYIISDMKFLIKNVESMLAKMDHLVLPSAVSKITPVIADYLNVEQKDAVKAIFEDPFCYIWGAPGTGKTKAVLFESLINYISQEKQVVILAPTNSALEQILSSVLPLLEQTNFDMQKVVRLGISSNDYTTKFPQTLLDSNVSKKKSSRFKTSSLDIFEEADIPKQRSKDRIKRSLIIASTIDSFILAKIRGEIKSSYYHIFVDEAGFAPMIKVASLLDDDIPLTLLGDHKQLSPICEMSKDDIINSHETLSFWDVPSIYLSLFNKSKNCDMILAYSFVSNTMALLLFPKPGISIYICLKSLKLPLKARFIISLLLPHPCRKTISCFDF